MANSPFPRVAILSAGLIFASALICYADLGFSLARADADALVGLPEASQQQARELYAAVRWQPWSATADMRLGEFFLTNNRPASALVWLARSVRWDTGDWHAWYYLGLAQRASHNYPDAQAAFRRVVELNPDYVAARFRQADLLLDQGRFDTALAVYQALGRYGAEPAHLAESTGTALLREKKYSEAAIAFNRAITGFAPYGAAHDGLAEAMRALGDDLRATREARLARTARGVIPAHSDDPLTEQMEQDFPTALTLYQHGARDTDPRRAAATMEKALALDPGMTIAWETIISIYGRAHLPNDAERAWTQLSRLDPGNIRGRYDLGVALGQNGQRAKAAVYLNQVLAMDPSNASANRMLGQLAELEGNTAEAARQFHTALEKDPTAAETHVDLGMLLLKSGDTRGAEDELLRALLPPCDQPERTLLRELADLRNQPIAENYAEAVRVQAEQKGQPVLIALLNDRKKPGTKPIGLPNPAR